MSFKRIFPGGIAFFFCLLLAGLAVLPHILPPLAGKILREKISQMAGLPGFELKVRSVGLFSVELGEITTGTTLSLRSLHLGYSPAGLMEGRLGTLALSGLTLRGSLVDGRIHLMDFPDLVSAKSHASNASPLSPPPLIPARVEVRHARLDLELGDNHLIIPFDLVILPDGEALKANIKLTLFPFGRKITLLAAAGLNHGLERGEVSAPGFDLSSLQGLVEKFLPGLRLKGLTDLTISFTPDKSWAFSLSRLGLDAPFPLWVQDVKIRLSQDGKRIVADGQCRVKTGHTSPLYLLFQAGVGPDGAWDLELSSPRTEGRNLLVTAGGYEAGISAPSLELHARGRALTGSLDFRAACVGTDLPLKETQAHAGGVTLQGRGSFDFSPKGRGASLNFKGETGRISGETADIRWGLKKINFKGDLALNREGAVKLSILPRLRGGKFVCDGLDMAAAGIEMALPLVFPQGDEFSGNVKLSMDKDSLWNKKHTGFFSIASISHHKKSLASMSGRLVQEGEGASLQGEALLLPRSIVEAGSAPPVKELPIALKFTAAAGWNPHMGVMAGARFSLDEIRLTRERMESFIPDLPVDLEMNLGLKARGQLEFGGRGVEGKTTITLSNGECRWDEKQLNIEGINTILTLTDPMNPRSLSGMILTADAVEAGEIRITNARVRYTLESLKSLLIEKAAFDWCRGRVASESIRLTPGQTAFDLTLYCDRIRLSRLLEQVGSFKAEGEGSLNGTIPIHYSRGTLSFENGFLYSTPGRGGTIRLENTEALTAGIPMDTPRFAQVDLASEALKNYTYDWASLSFHTAGDELLINMSFDGKPENVLPFVYKKEIGSFVRVSAENPGSRFQGIKIDVNLSVNNPGRIMRNMGNIFNMLE